MVDRFGLSLVEQERVWELWRTGLSLRAVARVMGQRPQRVMRYVWSTGGKRPLPRRRAAGCLSPAKREEISRGLAAVRRHKRQISSTSAGTSRHAERLPL